MRSHIQRDNFSRGLQTKSREDGKALPDHEEFRNVRTGKGGAYRRGGRAAVHQGLSDDAKAFTFGGTDHASEEVDTRVWGLGRIWTIEAACTPSSVSGSPCLVYAGHTTPSVVIDVSGGFWRARIWDSAATLTTLTSTTAAAASAVTLQVVRDGAAVSLLVDNVEEDTDTMSATLNLRTPVGDLRVMRGASTDYLAGDFDYVRVFDVARTDHADRLIRYPNPRARSVRANYMCRSDKTTRILDLSRFENHLTITGTIASATSMLHNGTSCQGVHAYLTRDGNRRILVPGGGLVRSVVSL